MPPALAGRFLITGPPGKSLLSFFFKNFIEVQLMYNVVLVSGV